MRKGKTLAPMIAILGLAIGLSACTTTRHNTSEAGETSTVVWLADGLQKQGVFVKEQGEAALDVPAETSQRLVLNGQEVVDVYAFASEDRAWNEARQFAGLYPQNDVYIKDALVVVRYTTHDTGLSLTLFDLLGTTL